MRILHITDGIPPATLGGTGRIVCELAAAQAAHGDVVGILTASSQKEKLAGPAGVTVLTVCERSHRFAHYRCVFSRSREREVLAQIDAFKPDIVHAHTVSRQCGYRWMRGMKARGIKLICTSHDVSHIACGKVLGSETSLWLNEMLRCKWTWNPLRRTLIRSYLRYADRILAVSDALATYMHLWGIAPVTTVHNGVDASFWQSSKTKEEARTALGLPKDLFLFLLAGRLGFDKGSSLVADALPKNAGLIIAGDGFGNLFSDIKNRVFAFDKQSADQMKMLYAACDAVLVPSRCLDCFPTVCLEAMAASRPVLATSWGGSKEAVQEGKTGWILDPLNVSAWRERMTWCVAHPKESKDTGAVGRKHVTENLSLEQCRSKMQNVYSAALQPKKHITLMTHNLSGRDGWSRYARDLSKALTDQGMRVSALVETITHDAPWCEQYAVLRPPLHCLSRIGCLMQWPSTLRRLRRLRPSCVHVIAEPYAILLNTLPLCLRSVITIHGSYAVIPFMSGPFARQKTMQAWKNASHIVSVSAFTKRYVAETEPIFWKEADLDTKIIVIENAIDLSNANEPRQKNISDERRILGVGAVKARKGYIQSLRALSVLRQITDIPFRYDIIGSLAENAYVEEVKRECERLGLTDIVHIRGSVTEAELKEAYAAADVFLMLSVFEKPYVEGFVLAFLEAAAQGIPCIGPNTGGCPEAIQDGISGFVCDPHDAKAVAAKMKLVLENGLIKPEACQAWAQAHRIEDAAIRIAALYE